MNMNGYAAEITSLTKRFGDKTAVDGISLNIEQGCLFALLGVNGAGKTTLIRMLTGLSKPTGGDALIMGKSILTQMNDIKGIVNLSPQESSASPSLTVRENLLFAAEIYGLDKKTAEQRADMLTEKFSMREELNTRASALSGGWQRRLSIAMALVTDPKILFLDEPTLGLDVLARRELWSIIKELKGNVTTILTTHYIEEAEQLCDRTAVMVHGKICAEGTADELKALTNTDSLENAFVAIAERQ